LKEHRTFFIHKTLSKLSIILVITRTKFQSTWDVINSSAYSNIYVISEEKTQAVWYNDEAMLLYWQMPRYNLVPETLIQRRHFKFWIPYIAKVWLAHKRILDFLISNHGWKADHLNLGFINFLLPFNSCLKAVHALALLYACHFAIPNYSFFFRASTLLLSLGFLIVEVLR